MATSEFSDVFVSYRRKDVEFVKPLVDKLREVGKEVWVDWEDIPGSVGFTQEIKRGLEGADTFICVLSPDYLESTYCVDMELKYAISLNKRIVPIVYRKFEDQPVPDGIGHINWVYFTPHAGQENTFDESFPRVIQALDVDLEHVRQHKRFLNRAMEWDSHDKKSSYLLNGDELLKGEQWLIGAVGKDPLPTELQKTFITTSRHALTRRQRNFIIAVTIALVISLALTVLSAFLYRQAEQQRVLADANADRAEEQRILADANADRASTAQNDAEQNYGTALAAQNQAELNYSTAFAAQQTSVQLYLFSQTQAYNARFSAATALYQGGIAQALALAAQAQLELDGNFPERGVLLAIDALEKNPYTLQAERTLGFSIQSSRLRRIIEGHTGIVADAHWSLWEDFILTGSWDGTVRIWETATNTEVLQVGSREGAVQSALWSPDGTRILIANQQGGIEIWAFDREMRTVSELLTLQGLSGAVNNAVWSPDGHYIAVSHLDGTVYIWDVEAATTDPLTRFTAHSGGTWSARWSPDGLKFATAGADNTARLWDLTDITQPQESYALSGHGDDVWDAVWSPNSERLITVGNDGLVFVWDTTPSSEDGDNTPRRIYAASQSGEPVYSAAWSPDGKIFATAGADSTVFLVDPTLRDPILRFEITLDVSRGVGVNNSGIYSVDWSQDGKRIITALSDGTTKVWDVSNISFSRDELFMLGTHDGLVVDVAWSADNTRALTVGGDRNVNVWDVLSQPPQLLFTITDDFGASSAAFSPDGTQVVVANGDSIALLDISSQEMLRELSGHTTSLVSVSWSPDGTRILTTAADALAKIWDASTGEELFNLEGHNGGVLAGVWSPDSSRVVTGSTDGFVKSWDTTTGTEIFSISAHENAIQNLAYSPDGTRIATASWDSRSRILDANTGQILRTLSGHEGIVIDVSWSPNNRRLLTASGDGTTKLWMVEGNELMSTVGHSSSPVSVAWSPDGRMYITGGADGTVKVWRAFQTPKDLIAYARECCAVRELTEQERAQFGITTQ